jgi:hypothetical protein
MTLLKDTNEKAGQIGACNFLLIADVSLKLFLFLSLTHGAGQLGKIDGIILKKMHLIL